MIGINRDTRLYLLRALMEWMNRWDLVIPMTAFGLRLKVSMKNFLSDFGKAAYKERPASPAVLIKTLSSSLFYHSPP